MGHPRRGYVLIAVLVALALCTTLAATYALSSRRSVAQATAELDRAGAQYLARGACVQAVKDLGTALGAKWPEFAAHGASDGSAGGVRGGSASTQISGLPAFPQEMAAAGGLLGRIAQRMAEVQEAQQQQNQGGQRGPQGARPGGAELEAERSRQRAAAENAERRPPPLVLTGEARFAINGRETSVWFESESGKIDVNHARRRELRALLLTLGEPGQRADALLNAIEDFRIARAGDNAAERRFVRLRLLEEPLQGAPLERLESLLSVPGMTSELYERLTPHMTTMSKSSGVDPNYASTVVLRAIGLSDPRALDRVVESQRRLERITRNAFREIVGPGVFPSLENGIAFNIEPVFTVRARAEVGGATGRYMIRVRLDDRGLARLVESREGWL